MLDINNIRSLKIKIRRDLRFKQVKDAKIPLLSEFLKYAYKIIASYSDIEVFKYYSFIEVFNYYSSFNSFFSISLKNYHITYPLKVETYKSHVFRINNELTVINNRIRRLEAFCSDIFIKNYIFNAVVDRNIRLFSKEYIIEGLVYIYYWDIKKGASRKVKAIINSIPVHLNKMAIYF